MTCLQAGDDATRDQAGNLAHRDQVALGAPEQGQVVLVHVARFLAVRRQLLARCRDAADHDPLHWRFLGMHVEHRQEDRDAAPRFVSESAVRDDLDRGDRALGGREDDVGGAVIAPRWIAEEEKHQETEHCHRDSSRENTDQPEHAGNGKEWQHEGPGFPCESHPFRTAPTRPPRRA